MSWKTKFGKRVRFAREFRGWTQNELALKCGLSAMWISHFECGRRMPNLEHFRRLCIILNIPASVLLGYEIKSTTEAIPDWSISGSNFLRSIADNIKTGRRGEGRAGGQTH